MSNEIVETRSADTGKDAIATRCRPQGYSLAPVFGPEVKVDLIGGNHMMNQFLTPNQGHKHVSQSNPTPASVKPVLDKMKEPSVLLLLGCEALLQQAPFPFESFKSLTSLQISGIRNLTIVPDAISEMTQLQGLTLSHLPITQFPSDEFFSNLTNLRSLVLRGCYNLHSIPKRLRLPALQCLDLSDISCSSWDLYFLSYFPALTHLFLRNITKFCVDYLRKLSVVDLSGVQNLHAVSKLCSNHFLVSIDLSRTTIQSVDFLSDLIQLRHLVLRDCKELVNLPAMESHVYLEVLDISGCEHLVDLPKDLCKLTSIKDLNLSGCSRLIELREGLFDDMSCLEKLDLSQTIVKHLPSFDNLTNLQNLNLSHTPIEQLPDLSNLVHLKELLLENCPNLKIVPDIQRLTNIDKPDLSIPRNGGIDLLGLQSSGFESLQEKTHLLGISYQDEFHLVSTFIGESGFDRFKYEFEKLEDLISSMEDKIKVAWPGKTIATTTTNEMSQISNPPPLTGLSTKFGNIHKDLRYILKKINLLESSSNSKSSEELLHDLMNAATALSNDDFSLDSIDLNEFIRVVAKLKLLVPPPPPPKQVGGEEEDEVNKKRKKKRIMFSSNKDGEEVICGTCSPNQNLLSSYDSLTDIQKKCLLYLIVFDLSEYTTRPIIKSRILIQLWYGEGFIGPGLERNDASGQDPTTEGADNPNTIDEIGKQILKVLEEKKFIVFFERMNCYFIDDDALPFMKEQAKKSLFFDLDHKNMNLTSRFTGSQRACLLNSQAHRLSSCQLWLSYTNSSEKLERFKNISTLLHVSESIIDLNVEWFSKMRNLIVLHLGNLNSKDVEHIDFMDLKFLQELKNMRLLRLLSLEGFSAIVKLPDFVCKLTNLRILNLRYCCNLEELPLGIGSLENLTYLDLTHCHLLSMIPKGLMFLSKLEVLKGFVITYKDGGRQHTKACTLRELLTLKKLGKLNLVVNRDKFPYSKDLHVFKEMGNLCKLQFVACKRDKFPHARLLHSMPSKLFFLLSIY